MPELKYNLFSCGSALGKGLKMISDKHKCVFTRNNNIVCIAERKENCLNYISKSKLVGQNISY